MDAPLQASSTRNLGIRAFMAVMKVCAREDSPLQVSSVLSTALRMYDLRTRYL